MMQIQDGAEQTDDEAVTIHFQKVSFLANNKISIIKKINYGKIS
jgi:hypothetical protein